MHTHHTHDHSCHGHGHSHSHSLSQKALFKACLIVVCFMGVEFVGGWFSNSLALLTDATHMLADAGGLLLSLFAGWIAQRPSNPKMTFGYHRAEILGSLLSGLLIWLLSGLFIWEAIQRLQNPPAVQGKMVVGIAVIGLVVNLLTMRVLHFAQKESLNVRAAYIHVLGDLLGSVAAIISGLVIVFQGWTLIDPLVTLFSAFLVLWSAWGLVREAVDILMESTPKGIDSQEISKDLKAIPEIKDIHDLHVWTVSSGKLALSVHLISDRDSGLLEKVNQLLERKYSIIHTTVQIEHPSEFKSERCYDCGS